jgi:peptidoglycan glycosyltransferase
MALVAAGVANNGVIMTPHVLAEIRDGEGDVVQTYDEQPWVQPLSPASAATMRQAMLGVVTAPDGTARGLAISGAEVGGRTGTAQLGTEPPSSHAWIIGFAGPPGGESEIAVAVILEGQDDLADLTGGGDAAPIANAVREAALLPPATG